MEGVLMCKDSTCACDQRPRGSTTGDSIYTEQSAVGEATQPFRQRLHADEQGRVYYHEVRLPFNLVNGAFRFRVKETWLRRKYGELVIFTLEDLAQLLCTIDEESDL